MELLLAVLIAAYAVKGVGADVAAAVAGKTPPSVLKWEARQKRRETPRAQRGYWGRIWDNAVESWADASTRRHNRRMALRQQWEARKGPEWIEKKLRKLEKAADRRRRFAERVGVLWGKAREVPENIRERRREDEAWAENARRDAERDTNVPAGLKGSTDLDADEDEGATVLPFRPRSDSEAEVDDALNGDTPRTTVTELSCCYGELPGREDCPSTRLWDSPFCAEHEAEWQRRRQELESASMQVYANPHHEALVNPALPCEWSGGPKGPRESCSQPRKPGWPMCAEHLARTDEQLRRAGERPFTPELAKWIAEWDDQVLAHISGPPDTGQDNPAIKEEVNVSNAAGISGEINDLSSGIELARQMRRYITDLQNTLETLQATMEQTSTGLRQVPASLELASASLQTHGLNGPALEELTVARERASMVSSALAEAVAALSSVPDHLTIANDSFSRMEGELSSQLGISEQVGAAAARGGVARNTDFYMGG